MIAGHLLRDDPNNGCATCYMALLPVSRFSLAFYRGRKFQIVCLRPSQARLRHFFEAGSIIIY